MKAGVNLLVFAFRGVYLCLVIGGSFFKFLVLVSFLGSFYIVSAETATEEDQYH